MTAPLPLAVQFCTFRDPDADGAAAFTLDRGLLDERAESWEEVALRPDGRSGRGIGLAEMAEAIAEGRPHRASGAFAFQVLDVLLATEAAAGGDEQPIGSTMERPASLSRGVPAQVAPVAP